MKRWLFSPGCMQMYFEATDSFAFTKLAKNRNPDSIKC